MMCPQPIMDQEAQYLAAIQLAATYNVQGSRLDLRSAEDALQATYTQQPAAAAQPRGGPCSGSGTGSDCEGPARHLPHPPPRCGWRAHDHGPADQT